MTISVLGVNRIGQISGSTNNTWPLLVDPMGNPLLTNTGHWWNVQGVDEGANAKHSDGRTYFFFGDVNTLPTQEPKLNSDLVAWTDESGPLPNGGHLAVGLTFHLPTDGPSVTGQPNWQGCAKCSALFYNGDPSYKGRCPDGGPHSPAPQEDNFCLPTIETQARDPQHFQDHWRCCGPCAALFWTGDPNAVGPCPAGGTHQAAGDEFLLPLDATPTRQPDWRFCAKCLGAFFDGFSQKGICHGAPGGGIHLHAVTADGTPSNLFDPFRGPEPIGYTGSNETPNGAFSYGGRMFVFAGIADPKYSQRSRPTDPQVGQYLFGKNDPSQPGAYEVEFLVSPKLGWCATDNTRTAFESHNPAGEHFVLIHDVGDPQRRRGWRCCSQCEAVFFAGDAASAGVCQRGGAHVADTAVTDGFELDVGLAEDSQNQSDWHQCRKCSALYWAPVDADAGLCPAGDRHASTGEIFRISHTQLDSTNLFDWGQPDWRRCHQCGLLFWDDGAGSGGVCTRGGQHLVAVNNFDLPLNYVVPFNAADPPPPGNYWRICANCNALFYETGASRVCPAPQFGGMHQPTGWHFMPAQPPQANTDLPWQPQWRQCTKCSGLFYTGDDNNGSCPEDGQAHAASTGTEFTLQHNPGADANYVHSRGQLRACTRCSGLVRADQGIWHPVTSPVVVNNGDHRLLPSPTGQGVVMISCDWVNFRLSWMPLTPGGPQFDSIRYYHKAKNTWTETVDSDPGYELFWPGTVPPQDPDVRSKIWEPHVCASWLTGPRCWIAMYTHAGQVPNAELPVVARFSSDLYNWSDEVAIFDPVRDHAYGTWMHDPALGNQNYPGSRDDIKGFAYGAFLINDDDKQFTTWDPARRTLNLVYVMSPSSPYHVQLMQTALQLPDPVVPVTPSMT